MTLYEDTANRCPGVWRVICKVYRCCQTFFKDRPLSMHATMPILSQIRPAKNLRAGRLLSGGARLNMPLACFFALYGLARSRAIVTRRFLLQNHRGTSFVCLFTFSYSPSFPIHMISPPCIPSKKFRTFTSANILPFFKLRMTGYVP